MERMLGVGVWRHCVTLDSISLGTERKRGHPVYLSKSWWRFSEWMQVTMLCELGGITYLKHRFSNCSIQNCCIRELLKIQIQGSNSRDADSVGLWLGPGIRVMEKYFTWFWSRESLTTLWGRCYYDSHFTCEETEAQWRLITCRRSLSY